MPTAAAPSPDAREWRVAGVVFLLLLAFHGWAMSVGWTSGNLPGNEFRQTQTAVTALFIQRDANFSLSYPTPVLGQPWSIPMEFPLYQWTVVKLSNWTGLALLPAGRAVSIACFYGALAALFPLLGSLGLARPRRLVVMGLVLSCPLYIFYARSFLIETTGLMFSLWFLVAFGRMITRPTWGWLLLVTALGVPAGLVKVTTYMVFLLPAGLWTLIEMRRQFTAAGVAAAIRRGLWAIAAIVLPVLLTAKWTKFADSVKHLNRNADFLESGSLLDFNFGTAENRFSAETLGAHWFHLVHNLAGPLLLVAGVVLIFTVGRRAWRQIALCLGCYVATLGLFPTLYAFHDYYAVANAVLLMTALGVAAAGLLDLRSRWLPWVLLLALHATQLWTYRQTYFGMQSGISPGGSDMTHAIQLMTDPDEVLVVTGYDWDSSVPFYSRRRALMIRNGMERNRDYLNAAFRSQAQTAITVLAVRDAGQQDPELVRLAGQYFNIDPRPLFRWADTTVYGRKDLRARMTGAIRRETKLSGVKLDDTTAGEVWSLLDHETLLTDMLERDRAMFAGCAPRPWKFYSQYGSYATEEAGRAALFAHPTTRLWFKLPAGRHTMRVECAVQAVAYAGPVRDRTDGVEFIVERERADGTRERLGSLLLDPAHATADTGWHVLEVKVDQAAEGNLVLSTGPGPAGSYARDWAVIGAVKIE
jgi:hypothetical protein